MNITEKAKNIIDNCRFCWMCRHVCPIGNATGLERNTARARAMGASLVVRGATELKEIADNIYECCLCGACTNNCMTGFDPKVFVQEIKTEIALNGLLPDYILKLINNYTESGNVYGAKRCSCLDDLYKDKKTDVLFVVGQDALYKSPESVKNACKLLTTANVEFAMNEKADDTGSALWYLLGKTEETKKAAEACANVMNGYKTVIVYDPVDLKLMLHEYKEWGIEVKANIISFNQFVLDLIESGKICPKNIGNKYTLQDNYAYARDLDDSITARKIIEKVGTNKEVLLISKEADNAGSLIMAEYMPDVIKMVAERRWGQALNMGCKTFVTENPAEYELLKANTPEGCRVITVEEMVLENL